MNRSSIQKRLDFVRSQAVDDAGLAREAVELAADLLAESQKCENRAERRQGAQMARMMKDPAGKAFTLAMADQVFRPPSAARSASQFRRLVDGYGVPEYLTLPERVAMQAGAAASALAPDLVMPAITSAMRGQSASVILPAEDRKLKPLLDKRRHAGMRMNLNQLGEAILGEEEAENRMRAVIGRIESPDCNYLSVKISSIFSQIHLIAYPETLVHIKERLRRLYRAALAHPMNGRAKFINLDMEEYRDLHLTCDAFQQVLDEPEFMQLEAGIVLQAYLPDSWPVQQMLNRWAIDRIQRGGAKIKIRIVKGANLAMENVEAELHGWPLAPYPSKVEVDANFKRMLHEGCKKENAAAVNLGVASHNLFDLAYAMLLRTREGVEQEVEFEMLEGMANHQARVVHQAAGGLLLYAPVVNHDDFHSAIAYLVRRLDENTADENFLRDLFGMREGDAAWMSQKERFLNACALKDEAVFGPRRSQDRAQRPCDVSSESGRFVNTPDTDWALPHNVTWIRDHVATIAKAPAQRIPLCIAGQEEFGLEEKIGADPSRPGVEAYRFALANEEQLERALQTAVDARAEWASLPLADRAKILEKAADELARNRGEIIAAMVLDAGKAISEGDVEVSEAIDFARYYAHSLTEDGWSDGSGFSPIGTVVVTPPWNFPFAIPCGGVLAALVAGNTVIFKPASPTVLTGWVLANCLWRAGVPREVLQFFTCPGEVGRRLVTDQRVAAVVLTGAYETARRFLEWRPAMNLFAETSGKNALIITAAADPDQAVKDLGRSAFGHSGQKCSAASLAIVEAEVYDHPNFRSQLRDAAASLKVGSAWEFDSMVTPCTVPLGEDLRRGLTQLDPGEEWLLEPKMIEGNPQLWSPGIRLGVTPESWYRRTECFGPVLGLIRADNLEHAIRIQNESEFGLTGGIHSLDDREILRWSEAVEVGNAYINRGITGAIVRRQPFGGWKRSSFGLGAKAGGPNYVAQFVHWQNESLPTANAPLGERNRELLGKLQRLLPDGAARLAAAAGSDAFWAAEEFGVEHDPTAMRSETNRFRYRRFKRALIRASAELADLDLARLLLAASAMRLPVSLSLANPRPWLDELGYEMLVETEAAVTARIPHLAAYLGVVRAPQGSDGLKCAAIEAGLRWANSPVIDNARVEWPSWLREQAVTETRHRYGNIVPKPSEVYSF